MTPQEFFKKDRFADNVGVELIEIKEGYGKARLVITEEHLNAGNRTQGGQPSYAGRPCFGSRRQLPWHTRLLALFQHHIPAQQRSRRHAVCRSPRTVCRTQHRHITRLTSPTKKAELVATFESSVFRKGDALPFAVPL